MNSNQSAGAVGSGGDVSGDSLSTAVFAFLSEKTGELSPYSVIHLRASLRPLVAALGDPPTAAVTYADLRGYVDGLHLRYKPGTIRPIVGDLRQFFRWAKKRRLVERNPAKRLRAPSRRVVAAATAPKSAVERDVLAVLGHMAGQLERVVWRDLFGNLCAAPVAEWRPAERQIARDLFILSFLYETGCRAGELWALGRVALDRAVDAPGPVEPRTVYAVTSTGKTGAALLRFTQATADLWVLWRGVHPGGEYAVVNWKRRQQPAPMTTPGISKMLLRRCAAAGVAPFRAHSLRHAKVKRARGAVGLEVAGRLIGHASAIVTAGYGLPDGDELDAAAVATGLRTRLF